MVISLDQKLIQCQSQPRVKVKLAYKGNSVPCQTLKNSLGFFLIYMFPQYPHYRFDYSSSNTISTSGEGIRPTVESMAYGHTVRDLFPVRTAHLADWEGFGFLHVSALKARECLSYPSNVTRLGSIQAASLFSRSWRKRPLPRSRFALGGTRCTRPRPAPTGVLFYLF